MFDLKGTVAVPLLLLCGLPTDGHAQSNPQGAPKPDAVAVLARVRDTYRNLRSYHFERTLLVQEAGSDGTLATIAELTLTTATEDAKPIPGEMSSLINLERLRLRTKMDRGEMVEACDGRTCWSYTSTKNEYMTGQRFRDVNSSVAGSMLLALHLFTALTVEEGVAADARIIREEEIEVGAERRSCYVIEGQIRPTHPSRKESKPPNPATLGVTWLLTMVRLQGLAGQGPAPSVLAVAGRERGRGRAAHHAHPLDRQAGLRRRSEQDVRAALQAHCRCGREGRRHRDGDFHHRRPAAAAGRCVPLHSSGGREGSAKRGVAAQ